MEHKSGRGLFLAGPVVPGSCGALSALETAGRVPTVLPILTGESGFSAKGTRLVVCRRPSYHCTEMAAVVIPAPTEHKSSRSPDRRFSSISARAKGMLALEVLPT